MKPRILMLHRQRSAVAYYRSWAPSRLLRRLGYPIFTLDGGVYKDLVPEAKTAKKDEWYKTWLAENVGKFDLIHVDREISNAAWGLWAWFRHVSPGCRMIVDFDDEFTAVPTWNRASNHCKPGQEMYEAGLSHLRVSELATVSTRPLADAFRNRTHAVEVLENHIDLADWQSLPVCPDRASDPHLRILYGGADGHFEDLAEARGGLTAIIEKPPVPLRLICLGAMPYWLHDLSVRFPGRVVSLPWVHFEDYPAAIAWGGFDLAFAPLAEHPFNETKSNIKWLEATAQGIPFIGSRVGPYAAIPDGCAIRVPNTTGDWSDALGAMLEDPQLRADTLATARECLLDCWTIDHAAPAWENALEVALSRPRIERTEDTVLPGQTAHSPPATPAEGPAPPA